MSADVLRALARGVGVAILVAGLALGGGQYGAGSVPVLRFTNNVVNADWYHPVHCHRFTPEEFRAWFQDWDILAWDEQEAGISCRARKR